MVDRYTKAVLTVIAVALVWLCLKEPTLVAQASTKAAPTTRKPTAREQMTYMEPGIRGVVILGVATSADTDRFRETGNLSYMTSTVGKLPITGMVDVLGPVQIREPVQISGSVDVNEPVGVHVDNWAEGSLWLTNR